MLRAVAPVADRPTVRARPPGPGHPGPAGLCQKGRPPGQ